MKLLAVIGFFMGVMLVSSCTSQQVIDNAEVANALIDLRIQYDAARQEIDEVIDDLPVETGLALLELERDADEFVASVSASWRLNPDLSPAYLDRVYQRGVSLYQRGFELVYPQLSTLSPETVSAFLRFQSQAEKIDALYQEVKSADDETRRMLAAGLELATLALRIGVMAL